MEKHVPSFTLARLAAALLFSMLYLAPIGEAAPKGAVQPAPPQPVEQKMTVKRGGSVDIPLKIYGTRTQTLSWIIKQPPTHGKLSAIRATAPESAVVTYRPPADLRVVADRFTFSVRSSEGVSAPVEATIAITDDAPEIRAPGELDFGTLLVGAGMEKTLEFSNGGGGIAEGTIAADAPWKVDGARNYKLPAGGLRVVKIGFAPERAGKFEGEVKFSSQPDRAVSLRGVAEEPLAVAPAELVLARDAGRPLRAASFELRNNTGSPLDVSIAASSRLIVKSPLHLAPHEAAALAVQTAETDSAALDETLVFTAGALVVRLPVSAKALPALVRARPERVVFRKGNANPSEQVTFENRGGLETRVMLAIGPPFSVEAPSFFLAPGAEKEIAVSLASAPETNVATVLKVAFDGGGFEIPVEAGGAEPPAIERTARRPQFSATSKPKTKEEEPSEPVIESSGLLDATVDSVSANAATFHWQGALPKGARTRCFQRFLSLDENGELVSEFREYAACTITQRDGVNIALVEKLEPGTIYFFRIDAEGEDGATPVTFVQFQTANRTHRQSPVSLVQVLFAAAMVTGGIAIWRRTRPRSGF